MSNFDSKGTINVLTKFTPILGAALGAQKGYLLGNPFGYRSRHTAGLTYWITNRYLQIGIYKSVFTNRCLLIGIYESVFTNRYLRIGVY